MVIKIRILEVEFIEFDIIYIVYYFDNYFRYININIIYCINVNKMKLLFVFVNLFIVMYKSVCFCFLYDLKYFLLSVCRLIISFDWCVR